jgi:pimeloyl-ACP methyl ester carboxylesterase
MCISFDNRGIGRSGMPDYPYTISIMVENTIGLMNALNIKKAHIISISMGAMIAQVMAIKYPEKISGLVPGCTHCGGKRAIPPSQDVTSAFFEYVTTYSEKATKKGIASMFSKSIIENYPEILERYLEISGHFPPSPKFLIHQREAVQGHDTWDDLAKIKAPTLVITGKDDILVSPENSRILAERISGSKLEIVDGGGLQFLVERSDVFNKIVFDFLNSIE